MGLIGKAFQASVGGAAATVGAFAVWTRHSKFVPLSPTDPIFSSAHFTRLNPNRNPCTQDFCVEKVPLSQIKPQLLEKEGRLVEEFVAGIYTGLGYAVQRAYLARKYQGPETADNLWTTEELKSSTYQLGTRINDHFEVVEHTPDHITVRCGGSPRVSDVRPGDGLFEMSAKINREEGVVEFGLKSAFFQGLGTATAPPMPLHIDFLHKVYTKMWMECGISHVKL